VYFGETNELSPIKKCDPRGHKGPSDVTHGRGSRGGLIKALYQSEYAIHFKLGEYSGFTATASYQLVSIHKWSLWMEAFGH